MSFWCAFVRSCYAVSYTHLDVYKRQEVGFVLMLPLVFTIAASANIPLLYVGVPMAAALSVTHGFLPPHPGRCV